MDANIALERFELLSETGEKLKDNPEIDDETKKLLDQRVLLHDADPSKAKHWEKALETIAEKFNYEL